MNIITGSVVMTIYFYNGLIRNSEIGNTPVWVLLNIWKMGRVIDTKLRMDVSNKMLLNAAKCQGQSFYRFWVVKGKPTSQQGGREGYVLEEIHIYEINLYLDCIQLNLCVTCKTGSCQVTTIRNVVKRTCMNSFLMLFNLADDGISQGIDKAASFCFSEK